MLIIVLILLFCVFLFKKGSGEGIQYPFFELTPAPEKAIASFDYCLDFKYNYLSEVPPFDPVYESFIKEHSNEFVILQRSFGYIANEYGHFYAAAKFMYSNDFKEIIYLESWHGIVPYLIAKIFNCKVHLFSPKSIFDLAKIPEIIYYNRLPNDDDMAKLKGVPLISFLIFMGDTMYFDEVARAAEMQAAWMANLLKNLMPSKSLVLYMGGYVNQKNLTFTIPEGVISPITFYHQPRNGFFLVTSNGIKLKPTDVWKLSLCINVFNLCKRHTAKNNYDLLDAKTTLRKIGRPDIIFKILGPLPKEWDEQTRLTVKRNKDHYIKRFDPKNVEYSFYTANYRSVKLPGFVSKLQDLYVGVYMGSNINDSLMALQLALAKIPRCAIYLTNLEFFNLVKGAYVFYGGNEKLSNVVGKSLYRKVRDYEEAKKIAKSKRLNLLPPNLESDTLTKNLAEFIKKYMTVSPFRIWVRSCEPLIRALHMAFPYAIINSYGSSSISTSWHPYVIEYKQIKNISEVPNLIEKSDVFWNW